MKRNTIRKYFSIALINITQNNAFVVPSCLQLTLQLDHRWPLPKCQYLVQESYPKLELFPITFKKPLYLKKIKQDLNPYKATEVDTMDDTRKIDSNNLSKPAELLRLEIEKYETKKSRAS